MYPLNNALLTIHACTLSITRQGVIGILALSYAIEYYTSGQIMA